MSNHGGTATALSFCIQERDRLKTVNADLLDVATLCAAMLGIPDECAPAKDCELCGTAACYQMNCCIRLKLAEAAAKAKPLHKEAERKAI